MNKSLCAGDRFYLLHVVSKRPLGSGLFLSSQPGSPGKLQEMLELEHAKSWIEDRFVPVLTEQDVRLPHPLLRFHIHT